MKSDGVAWNGSWNELAENPTVLGAAAALSCGISAGSGPRAREHASCKRQASGSNPLIGSNNLARVQLRSAPAGAGNPGNAQMAVSRSAKPPLGW